MERLRLVVVVAVGLLAFMVPSAFAQYTSNNYQSNEVFFGSGGDNGQSSSNYQGQASLGGIGSGNVSSSNYQAYSGFLTPNEPFLEMQINTSTVDLGTLDTSAAKTGTASFYVRTYVDDGYTIQSMNQPPSYTSGSGSHTLTNMATQAASAAGTEQFGINLRANTSPATFGSDPSPQPDSSFASGVAATGYDTPNEYKYVPGDTIARSSGNGWGQTNFTISYVANVALTTPAGNYSMIQDLVIVATY